MTRKRRKNRVESILSDSMTEKIENYVEKGTRGSSYTPVEDEKVALLNIMGETVDEGQVPQQSNKGKDTFWISVILIISLLILVGLGYLTCTDITSG